MGRGEETLAITKECIRLLSEICLSIDLNKNVMAPGTGKVTVYMELVELKNTVETLRTTVIRLQSSNLQLIPDSVLVATTKQAAEAMHNISRIDRANTADLWNEILLKLCQVDFLLAFQCHQLQEICSEQYLRPSDLLCTTSSKEFWEQYFDSRWFVSWNEMWERIMQRGWAEPSEEKAVKHFLDFCFDEVVSSFELGLFIKWFGPIELAFKNLILTLKAGILVGAIPATEANNLLKGKLPGSFLVRFSKTRPGCFAVTVGGDSSAPKHFLLNYVEPGKFSMQHSSVVYTSIHNFVQMQSRLKYPVTTRTVCELMADVPLMRTSVEIHSPASMNLRDSLTSQPRSSSISALSASLQIQTPNEVALAARPVYDDGLRPNGRGGLTRANSGNNLLQPHLTSDSPLTHHAPVNAPFRIQGTVSPRGPSISTAPMGFGTMTPPMAVHSSSLGPPQASASAPLGFGAPKGFGPARPVNSASTPNISPDMNSSPVSVPFGFAPVSRPTAPITVITPSSMHSSTASSPGSSRPAPAGLGFGFGPLPSPATSPTPELAYPISNSIQAPTTSLGFGPMGFGPSTSPGMQRLATSPKFGFGVAAPTQQAQTAPPVFGFGPSGSPTTAPFGFGPSGSSAPSSGPPPAGFGPVHAPAPTHMAAPSAYSPQQSSPMVQNSPRSMASSFAQTRPSSANGALQQHSNASSGGFGFNGNLSGHGNNFFPSVPEESGSADSSPRSRSNSTDGRRRSPSQDLSASTHSGITTASSIASTSASAVNAGDAIHYGVGNNSVSGATAASTEPWEEPVEVRQSKKTSLDICVICLDRERCTLFLECSHMLCCTDCSKLVTCCPICRQFITRVIPVYRS